MADIKLCLHGSANHIQKNKRSDKAEHLAFIG
jgi:hypothetical protein